MHTPQNLHFPQKLLKAILAIVRIDSRSWRIKVFHQMGNEALPLVYTLLEILMFV